jgi:hypothetical protein
MKERRNKKEPVNQRQTKSTISNKNEKEKQQQQQQQLIHTRNK